MYDKTVRILSLDGGGCRGYFQAKFLDRFCRQLGIHEVGPNAPEPEGSREVPVRLGKYFDIICGTSVGGIQALAYTNKISPEIMMDFFRTKAPWIFTVRTANDVITGSINASSPSNRPNFLQKVGMLAISDPFYQAVSSESNYGHARLYKEAIEIFGDKKLDDLESPVVITGYDYTINSPLLFGNVDLPDFIHQNLKCADVAVSTAAAPIYFPSNGIVLNEGAELKHSIIDGGVFQNNPSLLGLEVGKALYPSAKRYCVLSIGTGEGEIGFRSPNAIASGGGEATGLDELSSSEIALVKLFNLVDITMTSSQLAVHNVLYMLANLMTETNMFYFRFNCKLDNSRDIELDNSNSDFFDYLDDEVTRQYELQSYEIGQFISRLSDAA